MLNPEYIHNGLNYVGLDKLTFKDTLLYDLDAELRSKFTKKYDSFLEKDICSFTWNPEFPDVLSVYAAYESHHNGDHYDYSNSDNPIEEIESEVILAIITKLVCQEVSNRIKKEEAEKQKKAISSRANDVLMGVSDE